MKKGFTLIELLAVIIILAVVALIATPIVLDVVDDAKKSAAESETKTIVSGIESYCNTKKYEAQLTGETFNCPETLDEPTVKAAVNLGESTFTSGTFSNSKVTNLVVTAKGYNCTYNGTDVTCSK